MSIRRTIILLTLPLFLVLALVNGALLHFQERAQMSEALSEQALAAAVTSAEFISSMERPEQELAEPLRARALRAAARQIPGLDGLYLVLPGGKAHALVPSSQPWALEGLRRSAKAYAAPADPDGKQPRHAIALAPATRGAFVAARIDAEPMFAKMAALQRAMLLIVLLAGVIATALAWFVARRITRELEKNRLAIAAIGAGEPLPGDQALTIREVRDLGAAVRLMEASGKAAGDRSRRVTARRDRERTLGTALAATRAERFAPTVRTIAGASVALRIVGEADPGSFFAVGEVGSRGIVVLGRCSGDSPQQAFARAAEARDYLEANLSAMSAEACCEAVKTAYALEELRLFAWGAGDVAETVLLTLTDDETAERAVLYAQRNRDASAAELLDGIDLLLAPAGAFAAVGRS